MTPEQQRIAIEKAVSHDDGNGRWEFENTGSGNCMISKHTCGFIRTTGIVPDFLNDLYACHEARKKLVTTPELRVKYINTLRAIVSRRCPKNKTGASLVTDYDLINADALEHSEALVKVAGKWVEA